MTSPSKFSWQEVKEKGYVVAHGKVYDISDYVTHPGGSQTLQQAKGTDSTIHYDFHTKAGRKVWEQYCIGKIIIVHSS